VSEPKVKAGCGYAFMGAVIAFGIFLLWLGVRPGPASQAAGRWVVTVFGLLAIAGGFLVLVPMRRALARQRAREQLEAEFPQQPWKWRPDWNTGRIEATGGRAALTLGFFALFWNAVSWGAVVAAWPKFGGSEKGVWVVLLFPLVGLLLIWLVVYQAIRARRFGRPVFLPTGVPGVVGGYLGGVIHVPAAVRPEGDLTLALQACRTTVRRSGKDSTVETDILWEHEVRLAREHLTAGAAGTDIPVLFHIPAGQPDSELKTTDPRTYWRLRAEAAVPGVDFAATFEVPVFATGETAPAPEPGQPLLAEYREETATPEALAAAGIDLLPAGPGGHPAFAFTSRHIRGTKYVTAGLALSATTGLLTLGYFGQWIPGLFVAFFDLILLLIAYSVWTADTVVEIQPAEVVVRTRKLRGWQEQRIPRDQIAGVRTEKSMRSGESQYFKLLLVGADGADAGMPGTREPFALRKLRFQLERARQNPGAAAVSPADLAARLREQPRFQVTVAANLPGPALAESVARLLEEEIGIKR
jgi:hypothetical protein